MTFISLVSNQRVVLVSLLGAFCDAVHVLFHLQYLERNTIYVGVCSGMHLGSFHWKMLISCLIVLLRMVQRI